MSKPTTMTIPPGQPATIDCTVGTESIITIQIDKAGAVTITLPPEVQADVADPDRLYLEVLGTGRTIHGRTNAGVGRTVALLDGHQARVLEDGTWSVTLTPEADHLSGQAFRAYVSRSKAAGGEECYADEVAYTAE